MLVLTSLDSFSLSQIQESQKKIFRKQEQWLSLNMDDYCTAVLTFTIYSSFYCNLYLKCEAQHTHKSCGQQRVYAIYIQWVYNAYLFLHMLKQLVKKLCQRFFSQIILNLTYRNLVVGNTVTVFRTFRHSLTLKITEVRNW